MKATARATAQRLLNLYRQEHVIIGGWAVVNPVFVQDATDLVLQELADMPTGKSLITHIENLRSGKTPMDSIERELLPYGGMMEETVASIKLTPNQWQELTDAIKNFTPDQLGLDRFTATNVVRSFGAEWPTAIRSALAEHPEMLNKWAVINQTYNAYRLWNAAHEIIANPLSERARAQVQADMPEYETYLPMFGETGTELLEKLRNAISTM